MNVLLKMELCINVEKLRQNGKNLEMAFKSDRKLQQSKKKEIMNEKQVLTRDMRCEKRKMEINKTPLIRDSWLKCESMVLLWIVMF